MECPGFGGLICRTVNTMADGLACRVPNPVAVEIINQNVDHVVTVSDNEIVEAMRLYFSATIT